MVTSYLELLERMYADSLDDEARLYINFAVEGALRMNNLLDCLLQYSRITSDCKITEPVRCTDVLTAVIKSLKYDIDISGATIEMDDLPIVHGSKNQLFHLFRHLISNSMKYRRNDAAPVIAVRAEKTGGGSYVFSVEDNGIGIEKQYHQKIFDIFQRVHSRDSYGGYGLGLAVCRRIVERHNGRIWVESQPEKGTKVLFTLS
jgi:light-regulated signal transduction histidine kinase (bacteriophytochrome)